MDKNPLLNNLETPHFEKIKPDHVIPAAEQILAYAEKRLKDIEDAAQPDWDSTIRPLEILEREIGSVIGVINHLTGVKNSDALRQAHMEILPRFVELGLKVSQSEPIYQALKNLMGSPAFDSLHSAQQRVVEKSIKEAQLSGIELKGEKKDRFAQIAKRLSELSTQFSNNVLDATKEYRLTIDDAKSVKGMPASFLDLASQSYNQANNTDSSTPESGPWSVTLDLPSMVPFLQYCPERSLREEVYRAHITKASTGEHDNSELISEILKLRHEKAQLLGFNTFAELSLSKKMAKSVSEVEALLNELQQAAREPGVTEHQALQEYAAQNGFTGELQPWDVEFYAEKFKQQQFDFSEEELRNYFPFPKVLQGLFDLCSKLFSIKIISSDEHNGLWHPDVTFYEIQDENSKTLARFYLDPYSRPAEKRGGAWMDTCIDRGIYENKHFIPTAYVICNSTPAVGNKPGLLSYREVQTLFHEFGHALQHMLTEVDFTGAAGINGIEWDAVELPSQFMENWCFHKKTLQGMTSHAESGESLPDALFEKIMQAKNYRAAYAMLRQLLFGRIDMHLYHHFDPQRPVSDAFEANNKLAAELIPFPTPASNRSLCAFNHIFAYAYAAGYYSYKWAEVLSADAFSAFEEGGLDDQTAMTAIGSKFRSTVLALGGSKPPEEVFKAFRGREFSIKPLLRHNGLLESPANS